MYSMTKNQLTTRLGAVLFASFITGTSASAREARLALNERAAQDTIVETTPSRPTFEDAPAATLAHNEDAAQRVFVHANASIPARTRVAMDEAALWHNEIAAQRAIADASASKPLVINRISAAFEATSGSPAVPR